MKTNQIQSAIEAMFNETNHITAILIDGQWGVGKTYATLDVLRKTKSCRYAYSSFFGKTSIDELNTELYRQLNKSDKILNTVSSIVSLIGASVSFSGVGINLNGTTFNKSHKIKKSKKYTTLVVLDDLERMDENKITQNALLGYINQLSLQGIKVLALSNLGDKLGNHLGEFKEKVFDRIFKITDTPLEIAKSLVDKNADIDLKCLDLVSNNLRMFIKADSLYQQIKKHLQDKLIDNNLSFPFRYCLYVVEESLNSTLTTSYKKNIGKWLEHAYTTNDSARIPAINSYENREYSQDIENNLLITAIFSVFEQNDFSLMDQIYFCSHETSILLNEIFYLSDKDKLSLIQQQYNYILNRALPAELNLVMQAIKNWHQYAFYMDFDFINKEILFEKIYELGCGYMEPVLLEGEFLAFAKEYNKFYDEKDVMQLESFFTHTTVYSKEFYDKLTTITQNYFNYSQHKKDVVKELLQNNNYYMNCIGETINEPIWRSIHSVVYIVKERIPELRQDLFDYWEKLKKEEPNNRTLNQRINSLEKQYFPSLCDTST